VLLTGGDTMNTKGFSLVELVVVIAIVGTLLTIATLNFNQMSRKAQIEKTTRELLTDLNTARLESIYRKTRHAIIFNASGYVMKRYSSADEGSLGDAALGVVLSKQVSQQLTRANGTTSLADTRIKFDSRGMTIDPSDNATIRVNPVDVASFDCLVVSVGRTNIGKMTGGACVQQ